MTVEPFRVRPGIQANGGKWYLHDTGGNVIATVHNCFSEHVNKATAIEMSLCKVMVQELNNASITMQRLIAVFADLPGHEAQKQIDAISAILAKVVRP